MKTIQTSEKKQYGVTLYGNRDVNIFYSIRDFDFSEPDSFLLDGFTIILVRSGHATINLDGKVFEFNTGSIFISSPLNIAQNVMTSVDFDVAGIFISSTFGKKLAIVNNSDITAFYIDRMYRFPAVSATDQELFIHYLEMFALLFKNEERPNFEKTLYPLFQSFGNFMSNIENEDYSKNDEQLTGTNSAETIVKRFICMLTNQHSKFLSVAEYSNKLNITSKYLSVICKQVTDKTPSQLINEHIIREVKVRLANPNLSIKEISNLLGFANPSHFGVFLKRNTGKTAQELRDEM